MMVDPLILRQGKPVDLKVEIVRRGQRHPPQRGSLVVLHPAFPLRDREVVKPPEFCRPMEEGTDVPYFDGRDSQLLHELTPERVLDALPRLDVTAWKGDRAWHHALRRLPHLREHRRPLKDEGRYAFKRASVFPHAILLLSLLLPNYEYAGRYNIGR
jgi:hypothetical protein